MSDTDSYTDAIVWNASIEQLLARWCDQAKCFEWMHSQAYSYFNKKARIIMIISNLLTAISGLSNVIAGGETAGGFKLAWVFGSISILVSMANILQEKLAYAQMATQFSPKIMSIQFRNVVFPVPRSSDTKTIIGSICFGYSNRTFKYFKPISYLLPKI
jgi:hypothetical protein